jgi:signal transduction histidine kinase
MENAVYFTCMEAVQNAVKHASGATAVNVALRELGSELWFLVRDDGRGFPRDPHPGVGLESMRDRVSAAGGELLVASAPGLGTLVTGHVRARPAG